MLLRGHVVQCKAILYGSNDSYVVSLAESERCPDVACSAVYKPRRGEAPLWDFPDGSLFRREYATFIASRALGWGFVPPTVIRHGPYGIGTVQLFVPADSRVQYYQFREQHQEELLKLAVFDFLVNNADRKAAHCLKDFDGRIWAIDHGLTFHEHPKLRTVLTEYMGQPIPGWILRDLAGLLNREHKASALKQSLAQLLDRKEVDLFFDRMRHLVQCRTCPDGRTYRYRSFDWW